MKADLDKDTIIKILMAGLVSETKQQIIYADKEAVENVKKIDWKQWTDWKTGDYKFGLVKKK